MTLVKSFTKMLNDKDWISDFFNKLREYPIVIDYRLYKSNEIPNDILENLEKRDNTSYFLYKFDYITCKLRIINIEKETTLKQYIVLIEEICKFDNFIVLRGKKITKCDELHVKFILILNFMHKIYNQQSNNVFDLLAEKIIADEESINDHPLFIFDELVKFYNSDLKTLIENFISQANNYEVLINMYCQKYINKEIRDNQVYNDYELDRFILLFVNAFIQFVSEFHLNEENITKSETIINKNRIELREQAKKHPKIMTKDLLRKLLIYRNDHTDLSPSKIMTKFQTKYKNGSKSTIIRWFGNPDVRRTIEMYYSKIRLLPTQALMILKLEDLDDLFDSLPEFTIYRKKK